MCSDLNIVKGEFDEASFPETKVLQIGSFKIGLCHGHQVRLASVSLHACTLIDGTRCRWILTPKRNELGFGSPASSVSTYCSLTLTSHVDADRSAP